MLIQNQSCQQVSKEVAAKVIYGVLTPLILHSEYYHTRCRTSLSVRANTYFEKTPAGRRTEYSRGRRRLHASVLTAAPNVQCRVAST